MSVKFLRIAAAVVLLGAAGFSVAPYATSYVSISALVNAPIVSIDAPFDGVIDVPSKGVVQRVSVDESLFTMDHGRVFKSELRALRGTLNGITGEIVGLKKQSRDLDNLRVDLLARRDAQVAARIEWFDHRLSEARAGVQKAQSAVDAAKEKMDRITNLATRGMTPKSDQLDAEGLFAAAEADLLQMQATLSRLQVERDSINAGTGIDLSSDDMDQVTYRLDEITVRQADIAARLLQLQARSAGLQTEVQGLSVEMAVQNTYSPKAMTSGIIWEASGPSQSTVIAGEPVMQILNCKQRFLEVELPERHFENIHPGNMATVTLKGSDEAFKARIAAVYGSGARPNQTMKAASPRISLNGGLRVIVVIGGVDITDDRVARSFCDVGRSAEVLFDLPKDSIISRTARFIREFGGLASEQAAEAPALDNIKL